MHTSIRINPPHRIWGTRPGATVIDYRLGPDDRAEITVPDDAEVVCDVDSPDDWARLDLGQICLVLPIDAWRTLATQAPEVVDQWERVQDPSEDPRYVGSGL